jgi:membrane-associated phospholipid phosphatase
VTVTAFAAVLVLLIGFGRVYLSVHYVSDVVGGYLVSGVWLLVGIHFDLRPQTSSRIR